MNTFSFEKLATYQESRKLVMMVYEIIKQFPQEERFALCSQLQRSIGSVPANIAESCGRVSLKEKVHFLEISFGSLLESYCHLDIAQSLKYISPEDLAEPKRQFFIVSRLLNGLVASYKSQIETKNKQINL